MTKNFLSYIFSIAQKISISHTGNYNFNFENLTDDEYKADFQFFKNDVYAMKDVINIPYIFVTIELVKVVLRQLIFF